jgi:uncharacterized membrane protein (UPF0127 family)
MADTLNSTFYAMRVFLVLLALLAGCRSTPATSDSFTTREVRLPDGAKILTEIKATNEDRAQGMMFRDSLAADRGMLFVHERPGTYGYWMFNCRIPLDIVWLDSGKTVVEMSADTPPCKTDASQCPSYGGKQTSQFVVELQSGSIARHGIKVGDKINF